MRYRYAPELSLACKSLDAATLILSRDAVRLGPLYRYQQSTTCELVEKRLAVNEELPIFG